ncbi:MAG: DUF4836 family protein [Flavisolibacter sp.]
MKRTPFLCLLASCILMLASCKNANKSGLSIPKDAALVFHISSSSLSSKLSWDDIKKTNWYKDLHQQADKDSLAQKILDNPEASGINVKSDFAFFIKKRGRGGFSVFQGSVKDAAAFETMLKKMMRETKVEKDGDWKIATEDGRSLVTWNDSKFAVINDMPLPDFNPMGREGMNERTHFGADSLKLFVKQVMNLDNDQSLFSDDRFASVMKDNGDMHVWFNTGLLYSDMAGMLSMMKASTLFEGNVSAATISFEDGKISMKAKQFYNKEMQKALANMKSKNVEASVVDRIPSNNVVAVMAMNMDPAGIKEFAKTMGFDGLINMFLGRKDLSMDDILAATKGEFVISVSDFQMKDTTMTFSRGDGEAPYTFKTSQPDVDVLVASSVNKKESFDKLLGLIPNDSEKPLPFTYQLNNDWFAAGNKPASVSAFLAGNNTKHAFTEKIAGHPFGMYIDIQRLLKTKYSDNPMVKNLLDESAAVWKDFVAVGYEFKDGVATSEVTINMVDTKTNSLKQLNQFIEKMNETRKKNAVVYDDENKMQMDTDSTSTITTTPPPVVEKH